MASDFTVLQNGKDLYIDLTPHKTKHGATVRATEDYNITDYKVLVVEKDSDGRIVGLRLE